MVGVCEGVEMRGGGARRECWEMDQEVLGFGCAGMEQVSKEDWKRERGWNRRLTRCLFAISTGGCSKNLPFLSCGGPVKSEMESQLNAAPIQSDMPDPHPE